MGALSCDSSPHQPSHISRSPSPHISRSPSPSSQLSFGGNSVTSNDASWTTKRWKHPILTVQTSMLDHDSDVSISPQLSLISNDTFNDWSPVDTPTGTPDERTSTPSSSPSNKTGFFRFDRHSVGRFLFPDKKEIAGVHRACSLDGPTCKQRTLAGRPTHGRARRVRSVGSESSGSNKPAFAVPLIEVTDCDTRSSHELTYCNTYGDDELSS